MINSRWLAIAIFAWLLIATSARAQDTLKGFVAGEHEGLLYRLWGENPEESRPYRLVVYLHGAGEVGNDNYRHIMWSSDLLDSITSYSTQNDIPTLVLAPQCPWAEKWVNTDWTLGTYDSDTVAFSSHLQRVLSLIGKLQGEKQIDPNRIYASGISMGGYGVWDLLQRGPDIFAAAIPVCGAADTNLAEKISRTSIWTFHGDQDNIVPVSGSRDIISSLKWRNVDALYTEYAGDYHIIWPRVAKEIALLEWLFEQQKEDLSVEQSFNRDNPTARISQNKIEILSSKPFVKLTILDLLGRDIEVFAVEPTTHISLPSLQPPTFYKVLLLDGSQRSGKFEFSLHK